MCQSHFFSLRWLDALPQHLPLHVCMHFPVLSGAAVSSTYDTGMHTCDPPWQNHFPLRHNFCCALGDTRAKCLGGIPFGLYGSMPRVSNRLVDARRDCDRHLNFEIVSASLERNMEFEVVLHKGPDEYVETL